MWRGKFCGAGLAVFPLTAGSGIVSDVSREPPLTLQDIPCLGIGDGH